MTMKGPHDCEMTNREHLVEKLVMTLHLNVAERQALGSDTIPRSDVVSVISRVLQESGWFPPAAAPRQQARPVFEGHFLERLSGGRVRLWWQRGLAANPGELAEQRHWEYQDLTQAIDAFVEREWGSAGIDGVGIKG
jgi:hypothetical protein